MKTRRGTNRILNVARNVRGLAVVTPGDGRKLGLVVDAFVQPARGRLIGLNFTDAQGALHTLVAPDFVLHFPSSVVVALGDGSSAQNNRVPVKGVLVCRELLKAQVVTRDGQLIGSIADVFIQEETLIPIYRVTTSWWQRWRGGGRYLVNAWPLVWSKTGSRLIVPLEAVMHSSFASPEEALRSLRHQPSAYLI